ncbi:uncharacterized protein [Dendropsophus ebraccatus]|uniref:uncharacterized protein n=1 Tax=Dendropsophus ebraccatus TaxID=150705 RepID=UPI003831B789
MEPYSCTARNPIGRGESALTEIPVLYAATGVHITVKNEGEFPALICDFLSSRPDVTHYTWMKDGSILHNETEKTLTLYNNGENNGQYSCIAHNRAGNASSEEIWIKRDTLDLPLILGMVAGVFFLFFSILVVYFYLRQNKKSPLPTSPIHGAVPARIPNDNTMAKHENQYGNIKNYHQAQPHSRNSSPSVDVKVEDNYVIYSNSETMQPQYEVEYSVISYRQHNHVQLPSSSHEDVEYATLRH